MSNPSHSRRSFLKTTGITLAAGSVTCLGLGFAATITPETANPKKISGEKALMSPRILVTYATRAGSTAEIAADLAQILTRRGFSVDLVPVKEKPKLSQYQGVVLGSAVRMGSWLPEAVEFVKNNQAALNTLPAALFTVHLLNLAEDETSRAARQAYLKDVYPLLKPAHEAFFAGVIDPAKLSWLDRLAVQVVKSPVGDFRDWDKIRAWANAAVLA